MKIRDFLQSLSCDKASGFSEYDSERERYLFLGSFFRDFGRMVYEESTNKVISEDIFATIRTKAEKMYEDMLSTYKESWFTQDFLMEERKENDRKLLKRFLDYFGSLLINATVVSANTSVHVMYKEIPVEVVAQLYLKKGTNAYAVRIFTGKTKNGLNGKSDKTKLANDLEIASLKVGFDNLYKVDNTTVVPIYFSTGETNVDIAEWLVDPKGTKKSNVFFIPYEGKTAEEILDAPFRLLDDITCDCDNCDFQRYCQMQTMKTRRTRKFSARTWKLPEFDESQMRVVNFKDDCLLVSAGPGSGKTATLVGRVLALGKEKATEQMLMVTFTEKAAKEMIDRLYNYVDSDELPRVCTLNAFGMEVIDAYDNLNEDKPKHILLTEASRKGIISDLLKTYGSKYGRLTGVTYEVARGPYSTVNTVLRYVNKYKDDPESLFSDPQKNLIREEWERFVSMYDDIMLSHNYISYDEQITLATEYYVIKEIRNYFDAKYKYVMVDEYQDINAIQEAFISAIVKTHGNLVCIGDKNQSIYAFNGASREYFENFENTFPNSKTIYLQGNYRSTKAIMEFCNKILPGNANMTSVPMSLDGDPVQFVSNSLSSIEQIIKAETDRGTSYRDIAIIATQRKYLKALFRDLSVPCEMDEYFIQNDFLFNVVFTTLAIVSGDDRSNNAYLCMGTLFDKDLEWQRNMKAILADNGEMAEDEVKKILSYSYKMKDGTASNYVSRIAAYLDMDETPSEAALLDFIKKTSIDDIKDFYHCCKDIVNYGDSTKVNYLAEDKVNLITAHSSKGKEYPVVIVFDAQNYEDHIAETVTDGSYDRNLLFVSCSRATRRLYIAKEDGTASIVDVA